MKDTYGKPGPLSSKHIGHLEENKSRGREGFTGRIPEFRI